MSQESTTTTSNKMLIVTMMAMSVVVDLVGGAPTYNDECRDQCDSSQYCIDFFGICDDCVDACPTPASCSIQKCKSYFQSLTRLSTEAAARVSKPSTHFQRVVASPATLDDEHERIIDHANLQDDHPETVVSIAANLFSDSALGMTGQLVSDVDNEGEDDISSNSVDARPDLDNGYTVAAIVAGLVAFAVACVGTWYCWCHRRGKGCCLRAFTVKSLSKSTWKSTLVMQEVGDDGKPTFTVEVEHRMTPI